MTWTRDVAEADWIHLGYLAANVASVLVPMSKGGRLQLSERDVDLLKQQAAFFDAAIAGWSSIDQPSLLFHRQENSFSHPAGALGAAAEIYTSLQGGLVADPDAFKTEMEDYSSVLKRIIQGHSAGVEARPAIKRLLRFLDALIARAQATLQKSSSSPR